MPLHWFQKRPGQRGVNQAHYMEVSIKYSLPCSFLTWWIIAMLIPNMMGHNFRYLKRSSFRGSRRHMMIMISSGASNKWEILIRCLFSAFLILIIILAFKDGAPPHTGSQTQEFMMENFKDFLTKEEWPPCSPDLNPLVRICLNHIVLLFLVFNHYHLRTMPSGVTWSSALVSYPTHLLKSWKLLLPRSGTPWKGTTWNRCVMTSCLGLHE